MASNSGSSAASLLDVAIRAAVQSGAPRRTVAATAAAVASVVMVELRGDAGARGSAVALSASQKRRIKRKKKAEKEKLATSSQSLPNEEEASHGAGLGEASAVSPASAPVAPILSPTSGHPPLLPPIAEDMPPNSCQHCGQTFESRNKLFIHLKESGHSQFYAPRSAGDSASVSGLSAGSLEASPTSIPDQSVAAVADSTVIAPNLQNGGSAGSAPAGSGARSEPHVISSSPPRSAKLRDGKGRANRPY